MFWRIFPFGINQFLPMHLYFFFGYFLYQNDIIINIEFGYWYLPIFPIKYSVKCKHRYLFEIIFMITTIKYIDVLLLDP